MEKNSKLRSFLRKRKASVYTFCKDNQQTLSIYANNFLKEKNKISQEAINIVIERAVGDRINLKNELKKIENLHLKKYFYRRYLEIN